MTQQIITIGLIVAAIAVVVFVGLFLSFINIWIRAVLARAPVSFLNLVGMKLRRVPPSLIVDARIMSVKAGRPSAVKPDRP